MDLADAMTTEGRVGGGVAVLRIGERFTADRLIHAEGMTQLYHGRDLQDGSRVAIRVMSPAATRHQASIARCIEERLACDLLEHPALVVSRALGRMEDGGLYVVSPWLEGLDLEQLLADAPPLSAARVAAIASPLADALDAMHRRGLVHRALCPRKIRIVQRADEPRVVLTGCGFGPLVAPVGDLTDRPTATIGNPALIPYVAPETGRGAVSDGRVDVYALATIAFRLLTGSVPFPDARSLTEAVVQRMTEPPPKVCERLRAPVAQAVESVIAKGLARDPADRYPTATAFVAALGAASSASPARAGARRREAGDGASALSDALEALGERRRSASALQSRDTRVSLEMVTTATRRRPSAPPEGDEAFELRVVKTSAQAGAASPDEEPTFSLVRPSGASRHLGSAAEEQPDLDDEWPGEPTPARDLGDRDLGDDIATVPPPAGAEAVPSPPPLAPPPPPREGTSAACRVTPIPGAPRLPREVTAAPCASPEARLDGPGVSADAPSEAAAARARRSRCVTAQAVTVDRRDRRPSVPPHGPSQPPPERRQPADHAVLIGPPRWYPVVLAVLTFALASALWMLWIW